MSLAHSRGFICLYGEICEALCPTLGSDCFFVPVRGLGAKNISKRLCDHLIFGHMEICLPGVSDVMIWQGMSGVCSSGNDYSPGVGLGADAWRDLPL